MLLFWTELLFTATVLMISRFSVHEMFCQILELQWQPGTWPCALFLISPPAKQNDLQAKMRAHTWHSSFGSVASLTHNFILFFYGDHCSSAFSKERPILDKLVFPYRSLDFIARVTFRLDSMMDPCGFCPTQHFLWFMGKGENCYFRNTFFLGFWSFFGYFAFAFAALAMAQISLCLIES